MKISVSKSSLVNGVSIVSKAVPAKTTMSILLCILIKADKGKITLTANDMDLGIETEIEGEIISEGNVALEAKFFSEIVRKLPESDVTIDVDTSFVTKITCENSKFNLIGKNGDEFAALPTINKSNNVLLSEYSLKNMIKKTLFCAAVNSNNPLLNSELIRINGDTFEIVALDGHRIAYRSISLKNTYNDTKLIVNGKSLNEVERILSDDPNKDVIMYYDTNHVLFEFDKTIIVSRLVNGKYFDYEKMLITDYETKVHFNKKDLLNSIDRSTLLLREGEKKPVIITVTENNLNVYIKSMVGEMSEDIVSTKSGRDIEIGFNPQFVIDTLKVIDEEEVDMYMTSSKIPSIIRNEDNSYIYLVLPVNYNK